MHHLPLWFLVLSLFLPRLTLLLAWLSHWHFPRGPMWGALYAPIVGPILWLVLPRLLVIVMIFLAQGIGLWFILHILVAFGVFGYGGHRTVNRNG